ncbi:MAG: homoserine dehydrogenase [Gammaproteobacteria bacterium]|nr:homoserine dehydrogenase [Gammaproteobacteria bacterium]
MSQLAPVRVGLLGLGTVGGGTINVLRRNAAEITRRAGRAIAIRCATARSIDKPRRADLGGIKLLKDPFAIVNSPDIDVVVELIGGIEPARALVLQAIANGKHVVTANKALIALHGNEIFAAAHAAGVIVAFEAAVAGGIPIIKTMREALAGNTIEWLAGIINGTCNYILTAMSTAGREFGDVLKEAQALGYAEADPSFDIEGIDAAHKLTILASIAFGIPLQFPRVLVEGITQVSREDVRYAAQLGYHIKLLGIARRTPDGIELRVHPTLIPEQRLIANVNGVMNAVLVRGDAAGPMLLYGAGAGSEPTASAVVADLVDVARVLTSDPENRVPHLAFQPDALTDVPILEPGAIETGYYLRMHALDKPGVLAEVTRILAEQQISIEAISQREPLADEDVVPVIIITQRIREAAMNAAIARIEALPSVSGPVTRLRLEHLE